MNTLIEVTENVANDATVQTMSSIEIAEVCGKQHKNVMRDIKQIFTELKFEPSDFAGVYKDSTGRTLPCYNLPKRECLILVSGYSTALRAKIIDRWQELEKQVAVPQVDYSKPEALLGVLNHLQSQIEQKDHVIAELTPKAEALEGLKRSDGLFGLIEAAKMLEVRPKDLTDYLRKNDWVYRRLQGRLCYPIKIKSRKALWIALRLLFKDPMVQKRSSLQQKSPPEDWHA
ncbi:hypothetical protein GCM10023260_13680 [Bartonella acomydis]|uniref:Antirepressor protein C-terminal domain-containing protein n=1 Tax=Bartonella acomydis TaxID=686234 RepID=A0ABP9MUM3_9HYPH